MLAENGSEVTIPDHTPITQWHTSKQGRSMTPQRDLRWTIRNMRERQGLTQRAVAEALAWSESKVQRIENGTTSLTAPALKALLRLFGVTDHEAAELTTLERQSRKQTWRADYRQDISPTFYRFLGYEEEAISVRQYQSTVVPAPLQTEDYFNHFTQALSANQDRIRIARQIAVMRRQSWRTISSRGSLELLLDETVLRRRVGSWAIMRDQLAEIRTFAQESNFTVRVVPLDAVGFGGLATSFHIFTFDHGAEVRRAPDSVVALDDSLSDVLGVMSVRERPKDTDPHVESYKSTAEVALSPQATINLLDRLMDTYTSKGDY